jgi:hypothetical protein
LCRDRSRAQRANGSAGIARSIINRRKSDRGYSEASADSGPESVRVPVAHCRRPAQHSHGLGGVFLLIGRWH